MKSAIFLSTGEVVTASRDALVKIWKLNPETNIFEESVTLNGHSNFVNAVVEVGKSEIFTEGAIATGSTDSLILVWDKRNLSEPFFTFAGHSNTICSLSYSKVNNTLISGSYDGTSIVWDLSTGNQLCVLDGHKPSVLCVLALNNGNYATGGADKLIKLWDKDGKCYKELNGHTDVVRKLVESDLGIGSSSNDGSVRVWDLSGECLQQYIGHQSFVYGLACIDSFSEFVTCGEDQAVNLWKNGTDIQSMLHPGSVWSVDYHKSENQCAELVTGCSDGMARIWTRDPAHAISEVEMQSYYENVQVAAAGQKPPPETHTIDGKQYDYVWHVDLGEGLPMLKLGHNREDDPMVSAQHFIYKNNLDVEHIQTIVQFIRKNSEPLEITTEAAGNDFMEIEQPQTQSLYPVLSPVKFSSIASLSQLHKKIKSVNEDLILSDSDTVLSDEEILVLDELVSIIKDNTRYHISKISARHANLLEKLLKWPEEHLFPCNDLFRATLVHPSALRVIKSNINAVELLINSGVNPTSSAKNFMTAGQALANLVSENFADTLFQHSSSLLDTLSTVISNPSQLSLKASATTVATLLLNFAVIIRKKDIEDAAIQCATTLAMFLNSGAITKSDEVLFRAAVGLGTLLSGSKPLSQYIVASVGTEFLNSLNSSQDERVKEVRSMLTSELNNN